MTSEAFRLHDSSAWYARRFCVLPKTPLLILPHVAPRNRYGRWQEGTVGTQFAKVVDSG